MRACAECSVCETARGYSTPVVRQKVEGSESIRMLGKCNDNTQKPQSKEQIEQTREHMQGGL
jgi:hypothetical protein